MTCLVSEIGYRAWVIVQSYVVVVGKERETNSNRFFRAVREDMALRMRWDKKRYFAILACVSNTSEGLLSSSKRLLNCPI